MSTGKVKKGELTSDLTEQWRLSSRSVAQEMINDDEESWFCKRRICTGKDCAYVVTDERFINHPDNGLTLDRYEYWFIAKGVKKDGVRIDHEYFSPATGFCREKMHWVDANSPKEALETLLGEKMGHQ